MKKTLLLLTILGGLACAANAQSIWTNPITGTNPNTSNPYTAGQTVALNLSVSGIGRGAGANGTNANNRYNANSWNTASLDSTAYFTFTLTPAAGFELDLTSFVYTGQASGAGPTSFAFRSGLDGFTANLGSPTSTGATISLSGASFQNLTAPVEFRLYAWGTADSGGTFSVNDFTFNGTLTAISAVPEPHEYGIALAGMLVALIVIRRRKASAVV